jgi:hypothetical protein
MRKMRGKSTQQSAACAQDRIREILEESEERVRQFFSQEELPPVIQRPVPVKKKKRQTAPSQA